MTKNGLGKQFGDKFDKKRRKKVKSQNQIAANEPQTRTQMNHEPNEPQSFFSFIILILNF